MGCRVKGYGLALNKENLVWNNTQGCSLTKIANLITQKRNLCGNEDISEILERN